jgi:cytochrome c-type biogenesis protein CcmH/NrfF
VSLLWVAPPLILSAGAVALAVAARRAAQAAAALRTSSVGLRMLADAVADVDEAARATRLDVSHLKVDWLRTRAASAAERPLA